MRTRLTLAVAALLVSAWANLPLPARTPPDLSRYVLPATGVGLFAVLGLLSVAAWGAIRRRPGRPGLALDRS
jgi:hypothetical protein